MSSWPELQDLIWFFEVEPEVQYEDLGWPTSPATFVTLRVPWVVRCTIAPYDYTVELDCSVDGTEALHLKLNGIVDALVIERTHGAEAMTIRPQEGADLGPLRLQLKPSVSVSGETLLPWERR